MAEGRLRGAGEEVARASCPVSFKLTRAAAEQWVNEGMGTVYENSDW